MGCREAGTFTVAWVLSIYVLVLHEVRDGSKIKMAAKLLEKTMEALSDFPPLLQRKFFRVEKPEGEVPSYAFRIVQWNVLADALSMSSPTENFIKCPQEALAWKTRSQRSLEEILTREPDIICLEEVDHFRDFYQPALESIGYKGLFQAKSGSPCLKFSGNSGPDGCAIFYNKDKFTLEEVRERVLEDSSGDLTNQVALIVKLTDIMQRQPLVCAVTHLKAKPGFESLRHSQGRDILKGISLLKDENTAVVVCGDFNAEPTEPVCDLMKQNEFNLPLMSAYESATGSEPTFTTWKIRPRGEVKHTIDYVWHSKDLGVAQCLKVPQDEDVGDDRLPCKEYPSDHISLVFDLYWC